MIANAHYFRFTLASAVLIVVAGCGAPEAEYQQNLVYLRSQEIANLGGDKLTNDQLQNVADVTTALFGTPDDPNVPQIADAEILNVLDPSMVQMSAGKVKAYELPEASEQKPAGAEDAPNLAKARGLYRQHCVHCHGISGDGMGPTAEFLNPYPRDFRRGKYKFKSTAYGVKPRHEDLHRVIMEGVSGTAMPSFKLLDSDEVESLVHYVKYLSIRGEVERELMRLSTMLEKPIVGGTDEDPEYGAPPVLYDLENPDEFNVEDIQAAVTRVVNAWDNADDAAGGTPAWNVPPRPEWKTDDEKLAAWERGRKLFYGQGNCYSCHGQLAVGDGTINIYDEWTAELEPNDEERLAEYLSLGALQPRYLLPRNLRQGVFRGGRRPIDIYWRIRHGIEGSTMPAVPYREMDEIGKAGLTSDDIWAVVEYVSSLQYDQFSRASSDVSFQRDRQ